MCSFWLLTLLAPGIICLPCFLEAQEFWFFHQFAKVAPYILFPTLEKKIYFLVPNDVFQKH